MISMTNTYGNPWQTWRAITAPWAAPAGLVVIMTVETIAGILGTLSIVVMLANIRGSVSAFARGKGWMILAYPVNSYTYYM
jgi:predicted small integral membrane protein